MQSKAMYLGKNLDKNLVFSYKDLQQKSLGINFISTESSARNFLWVRVPSTDQRAGDSKPGQLDDRRLSYLCALLPPTPSCKEHEPRN